MNTLMLEAILIFKCTIERGLQLCVAYIAETRKTRVAYRRLIGIRTCESKCLFSGSHGEVCTLEPLLTSQLVADHPLKGLIIVAMATFSKVIINGLITRKLSLKNYFITLVMVSRV
jgi:hypothetical protein